MDLYESFKIDAQQTSQGFYLTDVFSGRFEHVLRAFLQDFKNKQQLTFKYLTQRQSRIENNTTLMCFVLCIKLTSWGRPKNVTMQKSLYDAIRTSLGRLSEIYESLDKLNCFCFLVIR